MSLFSLAHKTFTGLLHVVCCIPSLPSPPLVSFLTLRGSEAAALSATPKLRQYGIVGLEAHLQVLRQSGLAPHLGDEGLACKSVVWESKVETEGKKLT